MVKENTHLYLADEILKSLPKEIKAFLEQNLSYYHLGAVSPDSFFYHPKLQEVSEKLHGMHGVRSDRIIFLMLEEPNDKDMAFVMGLVTHACADNALHPEINRMAGDYYAKDEKEKENARHTHRQIETYIDSVLNQEDLMRKLVEPKSLARVSYASALSQVTGLTVQPKDCRKALKRQLIVARLARSRLVYLMLKVFLRKQHGLLGLFYADIKPYDIPGLESMEKQAIETSVAKISALWDYRKGKIGLPELKKSVDIKIF